MTAPTTVKAGEVWEISHARKGTFTVRFLRDADIAQEGDTEIEVVDGRARFISIDNWDRGSKGDRFFVRHSLTKLIRKIEPEAT